MDTPTSLRLLHMLDAEKCLRDVRNWAEGEGLFEFSEKVDVAIEAVERELFKTMGKPKG